MQVAPLSCSGCDSQFTPSLSDSSSTQVYKCEQCGRIVCPDCSDLLSPTSTKLQDHRIQPPFITLLEYQEVHIQRKVNNGWVNLDPVEDSTASQFSEISVIRHELKVQAGLSCEDCDDLSTFVLEYSIPDGSSKAETSELFYQQYMRPSARMKIYGGRNLSADFHSKVRSYLTQKPKASEAEAITISYEQQFAPSSQEQRAYLPMSSYNQYGMNREDAASYRKALRQVIKEISDPQLVAELTLQLKNLSIPDQGSNQDFWDHLYWGEIVDDLAAQAFLLWSEHWETRNWYGVVANIHSAQFWVQEAYDVLYPTGLNTTYDQDREFTSPYPTPERVVLTMEMMREYKYDPQIQEFGSQLVDSVFDTLPKHTLKEVA